MNAAIALILIHYALTQAWGTERGNALFARIQGVINEAAVTVNPSK